MVPAILNLRIATAGEDAKAKTVLLAKFSKAFNQLFLQAMRPDRFAFRQIACGDLIFQPNPLKNAASYSDVGVSALFSSSLETADAVPRPIEGEGFRNDDLFAFAGTRQGKRGMFLEYEAASSAHRWR